MIQYQDENEMSGCAHDGIFHAFLHKSQLFPRTSHLTPVLKRKEWANRACGQRHCEMLHPPMTTGRGTELRALLGSGSFLVKPELDFGRLCGVAGQFDQCVECGGWHSCRVRCTR